MAELTLSGKDLSKISADALVVGVASSAEGVQVVSVSDLPAGLVATVRAHAAALGVTGAADEVRRVPSGGDLNAPVLALTGLGDARETYPAEVLRRAAGAATRELAGVARVALALPATSLEELTAVAEGAAMGAYAFSRYRAEKGTLTSSLEVVTPLARTAQAKRAAERAGIVARSVHLVRDLVNAAPNDLFPQAFADVAKAEAKGTGAKVTVLDDKALVAGGYGGLVNVGKGSARGPRLVKVSYSPTRPAAKIALVGKGITFDSGGISIKPAKGMEAMKSDMAGAAAVLGTVLAAARLQLPVAVTGWLCLAENMPSGTAQRPSDVITIRGGKTVEVLNTDAEGRLVLADGLVSAIEEKPDVVLDIATLTGAQVVALGDRVSAVMGADDVRDEVVAAAAASGEQFWPMPLPTELRAGLKSKVADIANIGERAGGMLSAGLFLQEFVGTTPWAHLDIAGPAFNEGAAHGYTGVGGTGVGVRTLLALIEQRG
ncbi:putative cytosol aminopeptidase [Flavimobilis marinus]|uniref:Probable cytosol aminopeptidase n=1 Tax=Flavimobilis marinus TaxID=285351 RepID=A0A1I2FR62_9MICO|nr:leucyl aminopeptidase [Flavimobilis marinus]GHG51343.1 putative cytosol aminopeptidase [Flavimobilis marinus]SFF07942.1 leucyl aminopeptidase [Flavimobilis marinus]